MTDLTTLFTLLGSEKARDAAPYVPVTGPWYLLRNGTMRQLSEFRMHSEVLTEWRLTGTGPNIAIYEQCIWSGDPPALLAALVAERDGLAAKLDEIERYDYDWTQSGPENLVAVQYIATKALKEQQP